VKHDRAAEPAAGTPPYTVHRSRLQMVGDVRDGLTASPKQLSPKYFYDAEGSRLFEAITELAEYSYAFLEELLPPGPISLHDRGLAEQESRARIANASASRKSARGL